MSNFPDYYQIIGVPPTASPAEIKRAFRRRALDVHPDVNPYADAAEQFKKLNEAYQILGEPMKRAVYDRMRETAESGQGPYYNTVNAQEQMSAAFRELITGLRSGVFWAMLAFITFVSGMVTFQAGMAGLVQDIVRIIGALVIAYFLYRYAQTIARDRLNQTVELSKAINMIAAVLLLAVTSIAAAIIFALLMAVVLLEPLLPGLTERVMYSFPILLGITTLWYIISVFRRDPPLSIQVPPASGKRPLE